MVLATGSVDLVRGAVDAISFMVESRCSKCEKKVKKMEMVKHLENHVDEIETAYAADKEALERMADLEKRLQEEKEELLHKLETIDKDHKQDKKLLKAEKAALKEELLLAKIEEARLKALALSEIKIKCEICKKSVPAKDKDSHTEIHRRERRLLSKHLLGKHL